MADTKREIVTTLGVVTNSSFVIAHSKRVGHHHKPRARARFRLCRLSEEARCFEVVNKLFGQQRHERMHLLGIVVSSTVVITTFESL